MSAKTATSILLEFCAQQKVAPPQYESVNDENGPSQFIVLVKAFDLIAKGSGQSKKEAKHAASRQLIGKYKVQIQFIDNFGNKHCMNDIIWNVNTGFFVSF